MVGLDTRQLGNRGDGTLRTTGRVGGVDLGRVFCAGDMRKCVAGYRHHGGPVISEVKGQQEERVRTCGGCVDLVVIGPVIIDAHAEDDDFVLAGEALVRVADDLGEVGDLLAQAGRPGGRGVAGSTMVRPGKGVVNLNAGP